MLAPSMPSSYDSSGALVRATAALPTPLGDRVDGAGYDNPNVRGCWQYRCNHLANLSVVPLPD